MGTIFYSIRGREHTRLYTHAMWKWTSDKKAWISRWDKEYEKTNKSVETGEAKESMAKQRLLDAIIAQKNTCILVPIMYFHTFLESMITDFSMISFLLQIHGTDIATSL